MIRDPEIERDYREAVRTKLQEDQQPELTPVTEEEWLRFKINHQLRRAGMGKPFPDPPQKFGVVDYSGEETTDQQR